MSRFRTPDGAQPDVRTVATAAFNSVFDATLTSAFDAALTSVSAAFAVPAAASTPHR
ncbi:hypothetical protein [Streptomyces sp. NPDC048639]|uniref:hypothetical protein n=1 Tax=Streptomyces sp. NPDC048639 TaxID=3365581 RepID=UPI0037192FDA